MYGAICLSDIASLEAYGLISLGVGSFQGITPVELIDKSIKKSNKSN